MFSVKFFAISKSLIKAFVLENVSVKLFTGTSRNSLISHSQRNNSKKSLSSVVERSNELNGCKVLFTLLNYFFLFVRFPSRRSRAICETLGAITIFLCCFWWALHPPGTPPNPSPSPRLSLRVKNHKHKSRSDGSWEKSRFVNMNGSTSSRVNEVSEKFRECRSY